ncbi:MAG: ASCH domain-containing protein [Pantanalinema sp. GBBB05]|nr:ASCH domain-containing protein [Pantanalinema sp. GBBB05]
MRIISLWQPWASLIPGGFKLYETRSWHTPYRGKLVIHAAARPMSDKDGSITSIAVALHNARPERSPEQWYRKIASYPLGCIVAIADLADCLEMIDPRQGRVHSYARAIDSVSDLERAVGDWSHGRYAWQLANIIALPQPIPHKGRQGLRWLEAEVAEKVLSGVGGDR